MRNKNTITKNYLEKIPLVSDKIDWIFDEEK